MNEEEEYERCEECGRRKPDVETVIDPYTMELYAERAWITACKDCLAERSNDV